MKKELDKRKLQHIDIVQNQAEVDANCHYFERIKLIHRALPELNYTDVDPSCAFMGKRLSFPLLISPMTGGRDDSIKRINIHLAEAAETCQVALGVGSQRVLFAGQEAKSSFALRQYAPTTLLFANLGAVQLNYGFGLKECQQAVDVLEADALIFHLNPLQEIIQHSGNTNFSNLITKIGDINKKLSVPVILKEVGCGISSEDAKLALDNGIDIIDIAGQGGTSWSMVEHLRHQEQGSVGQDHENLGLVFKDWGIPTPQALLALNQISPRLTLIASGGIRNGLDMVKATILGATLSGMASPFLAPATESTAAVINTIKRLQTEYRTALFLLGCSDTKSAHNNPSLLLNSD